MFYGSRNDGSTRHPHQFAERRSPHRDDTVSTTSGFPLVEGENLCEGPQLTPVGGRHSQPTHLAVRQFTSSSFDKMVLARRTPTALAFPERKPEIVHVSPETMIRKHGADKDLWSQDHRSSYPLSQHCMVHENATKNTRKDVLGPVERTYHVCEWRTGTQGTDYPFHFGRWTRKTKAVRCCCNIKA